VNDQRYECDSCDRSFRTQHALSQHTNSVHVFTCDHCGEDFSSRIYLNFHFRTVHYFPPGIAFTDGHWIHTEQCTRRKSFGFFVCPCGSEWISAHAHKRYMQGCKKCEQETLPRKLWENDNDDNEDDDEDDDEEEDKGIELDTTKPHDIQRCQACRLGKCKDV